MAVSADKSPPLGEPLWLKGLILTQRISLTTALGLTVTLLGVYGWSVHTQNQWNEQYQKLQLLKRQERKLAAALETFENDLIANLNRYVGGLVKEDRSQAVYLTISQDPTPIPTAPAVPPLPSPPIAAY